MLRPQQSLVLNSFIFSCHISTPADLIWSYAFNYQIRAEDSQFYIFRSNLSSELHIYIHNFCETSLRYFFIGISNFTYTQLKYWYSPPSQNVPLPVFPHFNKQHLSVCLGHIPENHPWLLSLLLPSYTFTKYYPLHHENISENHMVLSISLGHHDYLLWGC